MEGRRNRRRVSEALDLKQRRTLSLDLTVADYDDLIAGAAEHGYRSLSEFVRREKLGLNGPLRNRVQAPQGAEAT